MVIKIAKILRVWMKRREEEFSKLVIKKLGAMSLTKRSLMMSNRDLFLSLTRSGSTKENLISMLRSIISLRPNYSKHKAKKHKAKKT